MKGTGCCAILDTGELPIDKDRFRQEAEEGTFDQMIQDLGLSI